MEERAFSFPVSNIPIAILSAEQIRTAGIDIEIPEDEFAHYYDVANVSALRNGINFPLTLTLNNDQQTNVEISSIGQGNVLNWSLFYSQIVVNERTYENVKQTLSTDSEAVVSYVDGFHIPDSEDKAIASEIFQQPKYTTGGVKVDYYTSYENAIQSNGSFIFIAGFLGLVFLISTGSILYFKQMTEAEQEKQGYKTLSQLGYTVNDIMSGIIRKQVFVFGLPLAIGLIHSVFAIRAASFLFQTSVIIPTSIAMGVYTLIYIVFALLTIGYYRKTVKAAV